MLLCIMYIYDYIYNYVCMIILIFKNAPLYVYNILIENVKVDVVEVRFSRCTVKK